jgi:hypothetical protein
LDYEEKRAGRAKRTMTPVENSAADFARMNKGMVRLLIEIAEVGEMKMTATAFLPGSLLNDLTSFQAIARY